MKPLKINKELTIRDSRAVDLYFQEINKIPVLTPEEEADLCMALNQGSEQERVRARNELVKHNLKFVISVAKRYQSLGYRLGDLIAIGNIGLIRAAEKFDPTKGFKFISYAVWWIRQQIMSEIGFKVNGIKLPSNRVTSMYKIAKFREKFYKEHDREPFLSEIAEAFDMDEELLGDIIRASSDISSINEKIGGSDDGEDEYAEFIASDDDVEDELVEGDRTARMVGKALSVLNPKERLVVEYTFGLKGRKLEPPEIAEISGLRLQDVKNALKSAMEKMKEEFGQNQ